MRHKHGYRKLGRTSTHRAALLKNLSIALIKSEKIETTLEKAKELRRYFEKLLTTAKKGDLNLQKNWSMRLHQDIVIEMVDILG